MSNPTPEQAADAILVAIRTGKISPLSLWRAHYAAARAAEIEQAAQAAAEQAAAAAEENGPLPPGRQWRLSDAGMFKRPGVPKPESTTDK